MRIALIQQFAHHDKTKNINNGLEALSRAAAGGAEVVCFAELAFERFYPQRPAEGSVADLAQSIPGPITEVFVKRARELGVVVILNLFERDGERCFDSSPVIDADGTILGVTRMVHITDYPLFHEKGYYAPGDCGAPVYETKFGRVGVAICYDRHFPEYMRALALAGAEVVFVPQAGGVGEWPDGLYEAEMQVAAFHNGFFVALCNRVGEEEHLVFAGQSFVSAPDGSVVARAPELKEHTLLVDLNLEKVGTSHARTLFLPDRRPELYANWLGRRSEIPDSDRDR